MKEVLKELTKSLTGKTTITNEFQESLHTLVVG